MGGVRQDRPRNDLLRQARLRLVSPSGSGRPMSRQELAEAVNAWLWRRYRLVDRLDATDIGRLERGEYRWPNRRRREAFRGVLGAVADREIGFYINRRPAAGVVVGAAQALIECVEWPDAACSTAASAGASRGALVRAASGRSRPRGVVSLLDPAGSDRLDDGDGRGEAVLWAPPGRFFPGAAVAGQVHPAAGGDPVLVDVPDGYRDHPFLRRPARGLVIGRAQVDDRDVLFGVDSRRARHLLGAAPAGSRLVVPRAYQLDELTFALLWAVTNLDEALLCDDGLLQRCRRETATYAAMSRSAVSDDLAAEMSATARMWLGSSFCADHILRHAGKLTEAPTFWTREQCGEQASTWLLFTHKYDYLRATADTAGPGLVRAFCVPRDAVQNSPRGERILLLLAVALVESFGVEVVISGEPEYAGTAGFVSDRRTVIVATWIGAGGLWNVDVTDHRPTLREYADVAGHAAAHSVIAAPTPHDRIRKLADYLGLDWPWLRRRCRELAAHGCAGLVQPRSRHLSVTGIERACRYLATADAHAGNS